MATGPAGQPLLFAKRFRHGRLHDQHPWIRPRQGARPDSAHARRRPCGRRKPGQLPSRLLWDEYNRIRAASLHVGGDHDRMFLQGDIHGQTVRNRADGPPIRRSRGGRGHRGIQPSRQGNHRQSRLDRHVGPDHRKVSADISGRLPKGGRGVAEDGRGMAEDQYAFDLRRRRIQKQEYRRMARHACQFRHAQPPHHGRCRREA